jgi:hypothetical protein
MKDKIKKLLQDAKTKEALVLLAEQVPEASVLLSTFNETHKRYTLGVIDFDDYMRKQNQITYSALNLLDDWQEQSASPSDTTPKVTSSPNLVKKVFISYSHQDEPAMQELDRFLGPLERAGKISIWTDRKILPGQNWRVEIMRELESADVTLLLVSANFLDSDFIHTEEIPRAFKRMNEHGKPVVPIILNFCLWDITPIGELQAVPTDGRPIADFPNAAQAWTEVARKILPLLNV